MTHICFRGLDDPFIQRCNCHWPEVLFDGKLCSNAIMYSRNNLQVVDSDYVVICIGLHVECGTSGHRKNLQIDNSARDDVTYIGLKVPRTRHEVYVIKKNGYLY
jgi:hypothetical protein